MLGLPHKPSKSEKGGDAMDWNDREELAAEAAELRLSDEMYEAGHVYGGDCHCPFCDEDVAEAEAEAADYRAEVEWSYRHHQGIR